MCVRGFDIQRRRPNWGGTKFLPEDGFVWKKSLREPITDPTSFLRRNSDQLAQVIPTFALWGHQLRSATRDLIIARIKRVFSKTPNEFQCISQTKARSSGFSLLPKSLTVRFVPSRSHPGYSQVTMVADSRMKSRQDSDSVLPTQEPTDYRRQRRPTVSLCHGCVNVRMDARAALW